MEHLEVVKNYFARSVLLDHVPKPAGYVSDISDDAKTSDLSNF